MQHANTRQQQAVASNQKPFSICWQDEAGNPHSAEVRARTGSASCALLFLLPVPLVIATPVYIESQSESTKGYTVVQHCTPQDEGYLIELKFEENAVPVAPSENEFVNYYEFLQISPNAQTSTIQRVYRFLASHYHPDNPETGDPERFLLLNNAYKVLSHPERRAAYDGDLQRNQKRQSSEFTSIDFLGGVEGELNRRLAVLAVLYRRCRANIHDARVSLLELEIQMGFPREYLDFTTWYLRSKKYITKEDNSDFSLTASGVDFVEANYDKIPVLTKLLQAGHIPSGSSKQADGPLVDREEETRIFFLRGGATEASSAFEQE